ncbi:MAG: tRNA (adenosine(37)-N6)-threonylcarbamoyltransferase complex ATPase subunit type 1 TsaE [Rhodothermia bacterium]
MLSESVDDTRRAGAEFAATLKPGDVIALEGDLGAGKTEFARGACEALGVGGNLVTSPTFTIVNEYEGTETTIFHIDAYRLKSEAEFFDLGCEEYFLGHAISFVEWPDRLPTILSGKHVIRVRFEHRGGSQRTISIQ